MSQFIDVIECMDRSPDTIVWRYPESGSGEIKFGAQLVVRESQAAVFFRDGHALDTFGPGRHTLSTLNVPLVTKLLSLPTGFKSPFRAEVMFVNLKTFTNQKWGTSEPILFRDCELQMVRLRAFGMYSFRVANPQVFVNMLVGTLGSFSTGETADFFRNMIVTDVADFLGEAVEDAVITVPAMAGLLSQAMSGATQPAAAAAPAAPAQSPLETIRQLAELRDAGAVTEEECQAKKAELLARI